MTACYGLLEVRKARAATAKWRRKYRKLESYMVPVAPGKLGEMLQDSGFLPPGEVTAWDAVNALAELTNEWRRLKRQVADLMGKLQEAKYGEPK